MKKAALEFILAGRCREVKIKELYEIHKQALITLASAIPAFDFIGYSGFRANEEALSIWYIFYSAK